ncbi:DUF2332 family protein [Paroceanicella profunda]|uniref:DUF2332 family protein n=1 Tax=Paroceanicella profunda TaxID=2579971 RepID=A0A5B8FTZ7_9RHOB|nr:DUF2332 family protein [Paroceanicella profunda]QDL90724.1 DUF2332 family protein [Paroceanicella profunda]
MTLPLAIEEAFRRQAEACEALGSPLTARVCRLVPGMLEGELLRRIADWPGEPVADALALRLCGGLHALARDGRSPALTAAYPPGAGALEAGLAEALRAHQAFLLPWLDSAPQTNEVARSGVLLGGALEIARRTGLPLELLEIGASAGLNLAFDRYSYDLGAAGRWGSARVAIACEWRGRWPDTSTPLSVIARAACDRAPVPVRDRAARARMLAYVWADQAARLARAEGALDLVAEAPWAVEEADAADWVEARLATPPLPRSVRVLMHSIMWQYMPPETRERIRAAMAQAGAGATAQAPLAWLRMEADRSRGSAAILLTLWPGGETQELGRGDFHGRWADWAL